MLRSKLRLSGSKISARYAPTLVFGTGSTLGLRLRKRSWSPTNQSRKPAACHLKFSALGETEDYKKPPANIVARYAIFEHLKRQKGGIVKP